MEGSAKIHSYRDLLVWQKGMLLAKMAYKLTANFPTEERFGLISQMRRAAISVPSNIAEGQARQGKRELFSFFHMQRDPWQNWIHSYSSPLNWATVRSRLRHQLDRSSPSCKRWSLP
jgi:hypothetical protein